MPSRKQPSVSNDTKSDPYVTVTSQWPFGIAISQRVLSQLFELFMAEPETLPPEWSGKALAGDEARKARAVCDYIAGMTDRYAIEEHRKLFSLDLALDL